MKNLKNREAIFWDFDGVILNSMPIREKGFRVVLSSYPQEDIDKLIAYHNENGGLSRYVKFKYFFNHIRNEFETEKVEALLANQFSSIMRELLLDEQLLNLEVLNFIKTNSHIKMHIVSGSDEEELRYLCSKLNIQSLFETIQGSPTPKNELVEKLLSTYNYSKENICLIGDSINDFQAANINNLDFFGYNNTDLMALDGYYIKSFDEYS